RTGTIFNRCGSESRGPIPMHRPPQMFGAKFDWQVGAESPKCQRFNVRYFMAHVVTDKCNGCKFTDCVEVCPVACFYELETQLIIHPEECIDCQACVDVCPVQAIY